MKWIKFNIEDEFHIYCLKELKKLHIYESCDIDFHFSQGILCYAIRNENRQSFIYNFEKFIESKDNLIFDVSGFE